MISHEHHEQTPNCTLPFPSLDVRDVVTQNNQAYKNNRTYLRLFKEAQKQCFWQLKRGDDTQFFHNGPTWAVTMHKQCQAISPPFPFSALPSAAKYDANKIELESSCSNSQLSSGELCAVPLIKPAACSACPLLGKSAMLDLLGTLDTHKRLPDLLLPEKSVTTLQSELGIWSQP